MKNHPVNNDYVQNLQEGLINESIKNPTPDTVDEMDANAEQAGRDYVNNPPAKRKLKKVEKRVEKFDKDDYPGHFS